MNFLSGFPPRKHKKTSEYHIHPTINTVFRFTAETLESISDRQSPDRAAVRVDTLLCFLLNATINVPYPLSSVNTFSVFLPFISHTEYRYNSRARMAPDHGPDIIDQNIVDSHFLAHQLRHVLCILDAVSMGDHDNIIVPAL